MGKSQAGQVMLTFDLIEWIHMNASFKELAPKVAQYILDNVGKHVVKTFPVHIPPHCQRAAKRAALPGCNGFCCGGLHHA